MSAVNVRRQKASNGRCIAVGGGLGDSVLAQAMPERGARVLVLERGKQFKDRVRGEITVTWDVKLRVRPAK